MPVAGVSQADLHARALAWASGIASAEKSPVVTDEPDTEVATGYGAQPFAYAYMFTKNGTRFPGSSPLTW